jgi:hypothetical protein
MAVGLSSQSRLPSGNIEVMRKHVFVDTTLVHPALIRASIDLLDAGNLVAGSDFPITGEKLMCNPLMKAMKQARLSGDEQNAVAAGNCLRLLGMSSGSASMQGRELSLGGMT